MTKAWIDLSLQDVSGPAGSVTRPVPGGVGGNPRERNQGVLRGLEQLGGDLALSAPAGEFNSWLEDLDAQIRYLCHVTVSLNVTFCSRRMSKVGHILGPGAFTDLV